MRSLREELTWAARESRRASRDVGADVREQARQAREEAMEQARQARDEAQSRPGGPATDAKEQARQAQEQARPGRRKSGPGRAARIPGNRPPASPTQSQSGPRGRGRTRPGGCASTRAGCGRKRSGSARNPRSRPGRDSGTGSARRRARGSPAASRTGKAGTDAGWTGRPGWTDWPGRRGRRGWTGALDFGTLNDLERVAVQFTADLRKLAMQSTAAGENVITDLRTILEEALERVKTEIFGAGPEAGGEHDSAPHGDAGPDAPAPGADTTDTPA